MSGSRRRERYLAVEVRESNGPPGEGFHVLETSGFLGGQDGRLLLLLDPGLAIARLVPLGGPGSILEAAQARWRLRLTADGVRNWIGYSGMPQFYRFPIDLYVVPPFWYRLALAIGCVNALLLPPNLLWAALLVLMHVERPQTWRLRDPDVATAEFTLDRRFRRLAKALDRRARQAS